MRALVVYESMFGNTQLIAQAVADGLASRMAVDVVEVGATPAVIGDDVALLVAGGPTHAFGMSRPTTRASAAQQTDRPVTSGGIGMREWLGQLHAPAQAAAAAFDTRVNRPRLPGSAARAARRRLRRRGRRIAAPAASFYVTGTPGRWPTASQSVPAGGASNSPPQRPTWCEVDPDGARAGRRVRAHSFPPVTPRKP